MSIARLALACLATLTLDVGSKGAAIARRAPPLRLGQHVRLGPARLAPARPRQPSLALACAFLTLAMALPVLAGAVAVSAPARMALAVAIGGAAGNVLDRLRRHGIIDFIHFELRLGARRVHHSFNIADAAIVLGAATTLATAAG
jgi:signal peptidase (SPase) II